MYDGFVSDADKMRCEAVRNAGQNELADMHPNFVDERLSPLLLHYKARNFPKSLSDTESTEWEKWRSERIMRGLPTYMNSLQKISSSTTDENKQFILQELHLWAESIMPAETE